MTAGPEDAFRDKVAETLQMFGLLVFHQRPGRTKDGHRTAVQYDGVGFPDLIAMRSQTPIIGIECKVDSAPTPEQLDWMAAGQGEGRYFRILRPRDFDQFLEHLKILDKEYPAGEGWKGQLTGRHARIAARKLKAQVAKAAAEPGGVVSLLTRKMDMDRNTPIKFGSSTKVFLYRSTNRDGTINVYGPVVWNAHAARWVPANNAKSTVKSGAPKEVNP